MKKKRWFYILLIILVLLLVFCFLFIKFIGFSNLLKINFNGENNIILEIGNTYEEYGLVTEYNKKKVNAKVEIDNKIDINKVGNYDIIYKVKYKNIRKSIKRTVSIVDTESPVIELSGNQTINLYVGDNYSEPGFKSIDNYDGDITAKVTITNNIDNSKVGNYEVIYNVVDSNNNTAQAKRNVIYKQKVVSSSEQGIAVLNYHFFYDSSIGEVCNETICLDMKNFREQLNYLRDNGFKTLTMEEFRAWMYGEIELPKKSVLLTIDDGAMGTSKINGNKLIPILEEYNMHATLFLITGWWDINNYKSDNLDVESHTHDMHLEGRCSGVTRGAQMLCNSYDQVVADLNTSISITNSTTAFCFPFYASDSKSIQAVKDVGFKLAFVGGGTKAKRSTNKYKIPRYVVYKSTSLNQFKNMVN